MKPRAIRRLTALLVSVVLNLAIFTLLPILTHPEIQVARSPQTTHAVHLAAALPLTTARPDIPSIVDPRLAVPQPPPPIADPQPPMPPAAARQPLEATPLELSFEIEPDIDLGTAVNPPPKPAAQKPRPKSKPAPRRKSTQPKIAHATPAPKIAAPPQTPVATRPQRPAASAASGSQPVAGAPTSTKAADRTPRLIQRIEPEYPQRARRRRVQGLVVANLRIDSNGHVRDVVILQARPKGYFEASARRALTQWRFAPSLKNGKPVMAWVRQSIHFQLKN